VLIRARIVVPVTAPPLEDGAVVVSEGRVAAFGRWSDLQRNFSGPTHDLGEVILLPGLVNAHCHLEYTGLAGQLTPPRTFPDWIKAILAAKSACSPEDFHGFWLAGAQQLLESGTTTVANIESHSAGLPSRRAATPLRVYSFHEMTGVKSRRPPAKIITEAEQQLDSLELSPGGVGLSPHAPYSTLPDLLAAAAELGTRRHWWTTTHVAESEAEFEMFMYRRGPMFDWLARERPMDDCGLGSPVQHLAKHGLLSARFLAVHANYLWQGDASLLAARGASVVHCPQSHAYFGHRCFPCEELESASVNVCLGTDSLASTRVKRGQPVTLSMFDEMRAFASRDASLNPAGILTRATVNGARALGLQGQAGEISSGSWADLVALPGTPELSQVFETILAHHGPVAASMIAGQWAWRNPALPASTSVAWPPQ
jgi:cytosine/adenosine deaminase-related metal-dependent hydrolase